jgi:general stress protein 26
MIPRAFAKRCKGGLMDDLKEKLLGKMREYTLASFATITEKNQPWTRYVVIKADENMDIWFATFKKSRKINHIALNPEVHLTLGVAEPQTAVSWLQVQGRAELFEDAETKKDKWYDMLEPIFSGPDDPNYVVCKVRPYRIEYYSMNKREPEVWQV